MPATLNAGIGRYEQHIDGIAYEFGKWGASLALKTLLSVSGILGAPMASFGINALAAKKAGTATQLPSADVIAMLSKHIASHGDEAMSLFKLLASSEGDVMCGGSPVNFDRHYRGRLLHMFNVARANFEVQYGSLTDAVATLEQLLPRPADSQSAESTTEPSA